MSACDARDCDGCEDCALSAARREDERRRLAEAIQAARRKEAEEQQRRERNLEWLSRAVRALERAKGNPRGDLGLIRAEMDARGL